MEPGLQPIFELVALTGQEIKMLPKLVVFGAMESLLEASKPAANSVHLFTTIDWAIATVFGKSKM